MFGLDDSDHCYMKVLHYVRTSDPQAQVVGTTVSICGRSVVYEVRTNDPQAQVVWSTVSICYISVVVVVLSNQRDYVMSSSV